jgi:Tfp pilus assembly protein PilX
MNRELHVMKKNPRPSSSVQRGAALLVGVVLLLLASVITILALKVGAFEARSTGNDIRAKLVSEVAEAGLSQGFEYLMRQQPALMEDDTKWAACAATDTTFPCGAVTADLYDHDGVGATAPVSRRSTMYRLVNSGHSDPNFAAEMNAAMLTLPNKVTNVSGFPVAYGVAPVLCYVAPRLPGESSSSPIRCASGPDAASTRRIATFVSVAQMPGETARTTVTQTVGRFALVDNPIGKPPIISSGSVNVTGGLQVVTNPNGGGNGVPVSVWTRKNVDKTGTPNTCYADEIFRYGAKNNAPPTLLGNTIVCDDCQCTNDKTLSFDKSGNAIDEGMDILDVEGTSADRGVGTNYNVRSDSLSYPTCEFPPDVFAHIFGVSAWEDMNADCFAEKKVMAQYINPNTGVEVTIGADEAFLYANAVSIINPSAAGLPLRSPEQVPTAGYPSAALAGLIWCQSNCDIGSNTQLGTPDKPVIVVIDGSAKIQGKVFGMVFIRSLVGGATLTPVAGYTMTAAEVDNGGTATLDMNAGAVIYGALVVHGKIDKANGTAAIVFDGKVLAAIGNNPNNNRYATLPGAWNDSISY